MNVQSYAVKTSEVFMGPGEIPGFGFWDEPRSNYDDEELGYNQQDYDIEDDPWEDFEGYEPEQYED